MFTSILLSFVTLSAALRRAAIHTQNLDEVAAADMQREVPHRILANLKAEMSAVVMNVAHAEHIVHNDSFDSALEQIARDGIQQADTSTLVDTAYHKGDVALMATTSKHVVKKSLMAHKTNTVHKANASGLLFREQHATHKHDVAHEADASEISRKLRKDIAHKAHALALVVKKERLAHKAAILHQAYTSKLLSKEELVAHKVAILHAELAALEMTRSSPSQALASELASLQSTTPASIQPLTTSEEAQLRSPASAPPHLVSHMQGVSPGEEMRAAFANTPAHSKNSWDDHMNASMPMPSQGFEGDPALHEDQRTMTADWMREHSNGDTTDMEKVCRICRSHMSNPWCQKQCPKHMTVDSQRENPELGGQNLSEASEPKVEGLRSAAEPKSIALCVLLVVMPLVGTV